MKPIKQPMTYEQQITTLNDRGLFISDEKFAAQALSTLNYYRFSGYLFEFKKADKINFVEGLTFDKIYNIYEFDTRLRNLLLYVIEVVEITIKTKIAYEHAHKYGALGYLDSSNFKDKIYHETTIKLFNENVKKNHNKRFVIHHIKEYDSKFPVWVAVELFTFGMIKNFYRNLKTSDQKSIAREFSISVPKLLNWLEFITNARNLAAHYMRLYNYVFSDKPSVAVKGFDLKEGSGKVFDLFYILKFLYINRYEWDSFVVNSLSKTVKQYSLHIDLNSIGFPEDWDKVLAWGIK